MPATIQLRPYQEDALTALGRYWRDGGTHPLVDMATGLGKSYTIAALCQRLMTAPAENWLQPDAQRPTSPPTRTIATRPATRPTRAPASQAASGRPRVALLTHVRELVEQDYKAIRNLWPQAPIGIYCAGLGQRDHEADLVVATIQSVSRHPELLGERDLVIIDEAHLVPRSGEGRYLSTIEALRRSCPDLRIAGFTATPYRLDSGRLDEGDERVFHKVVYSYDLASGIQDGWLAPLVAAGIAPGSQIDTAGVARNGATGDFVTGQLEDAAERVVSQAVEQIVEFGRATDRKSWLCFCVGVPHALHVTQELIRHGVRAACVTGKTPKFDRRNIFKAFRNGFLQALVGADVFTTGFDIETVDLVAIQRPTLSTGLFIQMIGRGTRLSDGKQDCAVMDFGGNIERHGPIDALNIHAAGSSNGEKSEPGSGPTRPCPKCAAPISVNARACAACGHLISTPHEATTARAPLFTSDMEWITVDSYSLQRHVKERIEPLMNSPATLRVQYRVGDRSYFEWLPLEHVGKARYMAHHKWRQLGGRMPPPRDVNEAVRRQNELLYQVEIAVREKSDGWFEVVGRRGKVAEAAE